MKYRLKMWLRASAAGAALLLIAFSLACKKSAPANVAATVNTRPITYAELDKMYQSQLDGSADTSSADQVMIQKLELLRTLVDNEIMLQRAERLGLLASDADV